MRNKNIILFSSGISEKNGLLIHLKESLEKMGYNCSYWRDLFCYANDPSNIALLPSLIKKIPTFDYAVLICEGHDKTMMLRDGEWMEVDSMRDNVLFEIGLCSMALGLSRTILLTDSNVHMPEDLTGKHGTMAIKRFIYSGNDSNHIQEKTSDVINYINEIEKSAKEISDYIQENGNVLTPVVIGAASSSAEGYVNNFIMRTLEHIEDGVVINDKMYLFPMEKVFMHIFIPQTVSEDTAERATYALGEYDRGMVRTTRSRSVVFRCQINGDELHIYDFPTSIITSYNTAKMILDIDADDQADIRAAERFTAKELNLFEATLRVLLSKEYVTQIINNYSKTLLDEQKECLIQKIYDMFKNRIYIEHMDY